MKKTHIIILVAIAISIGALIRYSGDLSTYESINSAKQKQGKNVHVIARLDRSTPIEYDPAKNPNFLAFYATDSLGSRTRVEYHDTKPTELEQSERLVMVGAMKGDVFECNKILLKCPSKYKDDKKQMEKSVSQN